MAVSCAPADIIANALCTDSCIPPGMQMPVLISIFCQIAGMNCDPASLMAGAVCLDSCIPAGYQMSVLISLACQILHGGGAGGGGKPQVFCGHYGGVMPTTPIPDPSVSCAINYDLDSPFQTWKWNSVALNWGA